MRWWARAGRIQYSAFRTAAGLAVVVQVPAGAALHALKGHVVAGAHNDGNDAAQQAQIKKWQLQGLLVCVSGPLKR